MTRILVQRGSSSSSSTQNRSFATSSSTPNVKDDDAVVEEVTEQVVVSELPEHFVKAAENKISITDENLNQSEHEADDNVDNPKAGNDDITEGDSARGLMTIPEPAVCENEQWSLDGHGSVGTSPPPPPPVPPPRPLTSHSSSPRRPGTSHTGRIGPSRRPAGWPVSIRTSPTGSRPSSPRSHCEGEGYNSADEQNSCFGSSYDDLERERQFEIDIRPAKGFEVRKMLEDGNCLFRAVADQVYGDAELYDLARQLCIDYMEQERDHFSQFITEGFTSYCKRKRRDKVYGNNVEIQAMSEMYNRPIHIYSYSTEPINIFHGSYCTDSPPIRLSYHHGYHYNSLVDPSRLTIGAGLGFSSLRGFAEVLHLNVTVRGRSSRSTSPITTMFIIVQPPPPSVTLLSAFSVEARLSSRFGTWKSAIAPQEVIVYADGSICLDILQNQWSPIYDVAAILTSIQVKVGDRVEKVWLFHCYKRGIDRVFVDHPMFLAKFGCLSQSQLAQKCGEKQVQSFMALLLVKILKTISFDSVFFARQPWRHLEF